MGSLPDRLARISLIGLDTLVFIYTWERHERYFDATASVLARVHDENDALCAVTSLLTVAELTIPALKAGRTDVATEYERALLHARGLAIAPIGLPCIRRASELRAKYGVHLPDAIHVAGAIIAGADAFLTNDKRLRAVEDIPVLIISDFVDDAGR